ncbi:hypothetical protein [Flavobacterium sp.]|uniref:hypothetical protein n=1 Tax=Flavobacterium sp. TaxID=239 RepID=UPI0035275787
MKVITKKIAAVCDFPPFTDLTIPIGYLWNTIDNLAQINGCCYSEFTHPRRAQWQLWKSWLWEIFLV